MVKGGFRFSSSTDSVANQQMTLEQKLEVLAGCGLRLAEPFTVDDLLTSWNREDYEGAGFNLVLVGLGMTEEQEPWRNHCVNLWHFDTECIQDHGDYKRIVERMAEMTQGSLLLENIQDYVDVEEGKAWFSFSCQGKEIKVDCKVEDDWVDGSIFATFIDLLNTTDPSMIYVYYDLGGQDCIIGCVSKENLKVLQENGIKFVPLA
ncbi:MAG: hypothetical protein JW860_01915 [Sedimentisphaerales bacterium]|nr:hypothetical protein [Sedimentisphaerales bacterium]